MDITQSQIDGEIGSLPRVIIQANVRVRQIERASLEQVRLHRLLELWILRKHVCLVEKSKAVAKIYCSKSLCTLLLCKAPSCTECLSRVPAAILSIACGTSLKLLTWCNAYVFHTQMEFSALVAECLLRVLGMSSLAELPCESKFAWKRDSFAPLLVLLLYVSLCVQNMTVDGSWLMSSITWKWELFKREFIIRRKPLRKQDGRLHANPSRSGRDLQIL